MSYVVVLMVAVVLVAEGAAGEVEWATSVLKQAADVYAERHPPSQAALREPRLQFLVAQDVSTAATLYLGTFGSLSFRYRVVVVSLPTS